MATVTKTASNNNYHYGPRDLDAVLGSMSKAIQSWIVDDDVDMYNHLAAEIRAGAFSEWCSARQAGETKKSLKDWIIAKCLAYQAMIDEGYVECVPPFPYHPRK